jgi:hypothetical protein
MQVVCKQTLHSKKFAFQIKYVVTRIVNDSSFTQLEKAT